MILGIGTDSKLWTRDNLNASWVKAPDKGGQVKSISITKDGTIIGIGMDYKLYLREHIDATWVKAPDKGGQVKSITIMNDGVILCVGMNNKLYSRADLDASWVKAPDYGQVKSITIMKDGVILGIGMGNKLYTRTNLGARWVKAPDYGQAVLGIACHPWDPVDESSIPIDETGDDDPIEMGAVMEMEISAGISSEEPPQVLLAACFLFAILWLSLISKVIQAGSNHSDL